MSYPKGSEIYRQINEIIHGIKDIEVISIGVVMHLIVKGYDVYIYSKCVTYAGNPYPQNTTRAQLPKREEFNLIKRSESTILFLGYDVENEVFVCWDPKTTKERLNEKAYVSFFSRLNQQKEVKQGVISSAKLSNNFVYVLFKKVDLPYFLLNIDKYFHQEEKKAPVIAINERVQGLLYSIDSDISVKLLIDELYELYGTPSILEVVGACMNEFGEFYNKMTLKDWYHLINGYKSTKEVAFYYQDDEVQEDTAVVSESFDENIVDRFKHFMTGTESKSDKTTRNYTFYLSKDIPHYINEFTEFNITNCFDIEDISFAKEIRTKIETVRPIVEKNITIYHYGLTAAIKMYIRFLEFEQKI